MVGVHILRVIGFNPIMALFGQQHVAILHPPTQLIPGQNPVALLACWKGPGKVAAIMTQSINICIYVFPHPIMACQFAEGLIVSADIVSRIIPEPTDWHRFPAGTHQDRLVDGVLGHPIRFVRCHHYHHIHDKHFPSHINTSVIRRNPSADVWPMPRHSPWRGPCRNTGTLQVVRSKTHPFLQPSGLHIARTASDFSRH